MSIDVQIVAAKAPIALVVAERGIYPLTPCCQASTKRCTAAGEGGVVCRACYKQIHPLFGACWLPDDEQGWGWYKQLLMIADGDNNADEIVAYARDTVNAVTHVIRPKFPPSHAVDQHHYQRRQHPFPRHGGSPVAGVWRPR